MVRDFILLFSVAFVLFCLYVYYTSRNSDMVFVKSSVDSREYLVRNVPDKQQAADLLASLAAKMVAIADRVYALKASEDEFCGIAIEQLKLRFNPEKLSESPSDSEYTSYSVNKGEKIFICLRNKATGELVDVNTLLLVSLHEITHVMTSDVGHTPMFWSNFKYILREATRMGIYTYVDYSKAPVAYCGMQITSTPYTPGLDDDLDAIRKVPNTLKSCR